LTPHGTKPSSSAPSEVSGGGGVPEITEAMIDAGVAQFHTYVSDDEDDPLSREAALREIISSIFRSMEAVKPEFRKKAT
jgi:hypothetical protein